MNLQTTSKPLLNILQGDSSFYAATFVREVLDASRSLNEFSERGRIVPELGNPNIRELFVREYRLIYSIEESRVVILGLIHGKRDLKNYGIQKTEEIDHELWITTG